MSKHREKVRQLMEQSRKSGITGNVRHDLNNIRSNFDKTDNADNADKNIDRKRKIKETRAARKENREEVLSQDMDEINSLKGLVSNLEKNVGQLEKNGFKPKMRSDRSVEWVYTDYKSRSFITLVINDYGEDFGVRLEVMYRIRRTDGGRGQFKYIDEDDEVEGKAAVRRSKELINKANFFADELFPTLDKATDL